MGVPGATRGVVSTQASSVCVQAGGGGLRTCPCECGGPSGSRGVGSCGPEHEVQEVSNGQR